MDEQTLKILHDKLRGVAEFEHEANLAENPLSISFGGYTSHQFHCKRCGKVYDTYTYGHLGISDVQTKITDKPCPIPDQFPGSEADIAEECRQFLEKHKGDGTLMRKYGWQMIDMAGGKSIDVWLSYFATPAQKINAFVNLWKEV